MGLIWEHSFWTFLLVTVGLGGGAAYLTGRAVAVTWRGSVQLITYMAFLSVAVRFIDYALFGGSFLPLLPPPIDWSLLLPALRYLLVTFVVLLAIAILGFRVTRVGQMVSQYGWLYQRSGPLGWRRAAEGGKPAGSQ